MNPLDLNVEERVGVRSQVRALSDDFGQLLLVRPLDPAKLGQEACIRRPVFERPEL